MHRAVVEWFEGVSETLAGCALLCATDDMKPIYHVRRFLTLSIGMPITIVKMEDEDAQGSVAFVFHENKTRSGEPSSSVLSVSNCHVLRQDPTGSVHLVSVCDLPAPDASAVA